jgi:ABC-type polysaccharide/polyol phosphate transport system ATPase subunit
VNADAAVVLRGVTLRRRTQSDLRTDLKSAVLDLVRGRFRRVSRRTVLDRIDLRVDAGEKLAVLGSNGSGKSTLLKVMAGVLRPTSGSVDVRGTLSPMIELGVGFDPDLTVEDNVVYYGVLLGHDERTVRGRLEQILDFAELVAYRNQLTKTLSSGMSARLGFAIATEWRPDVLLLDEALAVGDEHFRRKCASRIERFWDRHSTIVVVSHDLHYLQQTCDRGIWIEGGRIRFAGAVQDAVAAYLATVPGARSFASGSDLVEFARTVQRGELIVRGTSKTPQGEKVFLIRDGLRHWVTANEWYARAGYVWEDIVHVDDGVILEVPEGEHLT